MAPITEFAVHNKSSHNQSLKRDAAKSHRAPYLCVKSVGKVIFRKFAINETKHLRIGRLPKLGFFYSLVGLKIFGIDIFQILSYIVLHENSYVNNQIG